MPTEETNPLPSDAAVLRTLTLLATLSTSLEVWQQTRERRAGRDPSAQETEAVVVPFLEGSLPAVQDMVMRLQADALLLMRDTPDRLALWARRFDLLWTLGRLSRRLQTVHQRLLSLYPVVSEDLVETARTLRFAADHLSNVSADDFFDALPHFAEQTMTFCRLLQAALEVGKNGSNLP